MKKRILLLIGIALLFIIGYTLKYKVHLQKPKEQAMARIELPSGLAYEVINHGQGNDSPKPGQTVVVHYTGWLDNAGVQGKKFDSSVDRNKPFSFKLGIGEVIRGWDEGVLGMRKGEKRKLIIPASLGYGARGVPGNATLIFEVELLDFY